MATSDNPFVVPNVVTGTGNPKTISTKFQS